MDARIQPILADLRQRLGELYGRRMERVILFGSQARGDADAGSDIDVLVVLAAPVVPAEEVSRTIDTVAALSLEHDVVLSCVFVSGDEYERAASPLLRNARREGVAV